MRQEIVMPKMGESLQEGTITQWLKSVGDMVERDEMILEISTDKVDTEVPAPVAGKLVEILSEENETVEVGTPIAIIDTDGESSESSDKKEEKIEDKEPEEEVEEEVEEEDDKEVSGDDDSDDETSDDGDSIDVVMPKMGESLQEGTIVKWLKEVGDKVERDEMILEISTDKVDTEVPSPVGGTLLEILAEEGDTVEVGNVIAKISGSGGSSKKKSSSKSSESKKKKEDKSSDKSESSGKSSSSTTVDIDPSKGTKEIPRKHNGRFYSPLVRAIAEKEGVTLEELEQIDGSGIDGRVSKDDILKYIDNRGSKSASKSEKKEEKPSKSSDSKVSVSKPAPQEKKETPTYEFDEDEVEVIKMDRIRQLISEHMIYSKHTSAHVTSVAEVDLTGVVKFRSKHKEEFQKKNGFKLTYTPFVIKACVDAVKEFPMVNVSVGDKEIIRHKRINFGFATALPDNNLIVPVIKNADDMNITGLGRSVNDLASRARNKKLDPDDIQGGTITLTNVGTFGTLFGTPIINQPQTVIFGFGAIKKRPVVKEVDGEDVIVVRHMANISITYDHRVIDGMLAGQTIAAVVKSLENMNEDTINL